MTDTVACKLTVSHSLSPCNCAARNKKCVFLSGAIMANKVSLRLFCAWHNMWFILAVVELSCSAEFLVFLPLSELLKLLQVAWKLVAIESAFDLRKTN